MATTKQHESSMLFTCYHCPFEGSFENVVKHSEQDHSNQILKVRRREINEKTGKKGLKTLNFNIIPEIVKNSNQDIIPIYDHGTHKIDLINIENQDFGISNLSIDDIPDFECMSPVHKQLRSSTPHKVVQKAPIVIPDISIGCAETDDTDRDSSLSARDMEIMAEMKSLLPDVIKSLRNVDQLGNWLSFHQMVKEGRFPMENIAFHLFMDVCKFYSLENTSSMRFTPIVKRFWRVGYCLFHGKWLHFMGGPKNLGQKIASPEEEVTSEHAKINFAVPYRATVGTRNRAFDEDDVKPGLLTPMIDKLAEQTDENKTYKLCVDGKKINAGKCKTSGDIDLFGFEKSPTLNERKAKLQSEILLLRSVSDILDSVSIRRKVHLEDISPDERDSLVHLLLENLKVVGEKIRTLRETKLNKDLVLEKLKKQSGPDWRKSKFVFVISSLETDLYDISNCIKDMLSIVDGIGLMVASLRNTEHLYSRSKHVPLKTQSNYVHLSGACSEADLTEPRKIKQQSERWHEIRKSARVTGSSLNSALGLGSLKQQLEHFDKVVYKKEPSKPTSAVQTKMNYGSEQEINAIATLVGKVLPVFEPSLVYVEEGCYKRTIGNDPNTVEIVISPDGSLKKSQDSTAFFAIECKCPFPGKKFTTQVYYRIPKYYITQVLAEMYSMDCKELYFVCFSEESSTIFKVSFCSDLWHALENEMLLLYGQEHPTRPIKKSESSVILNEMIDMFEKENVQFVAEFPSVLAEPCDIQTNQLYCVHTKPTSGNTNTSVRDLQEIVQRTNVSINRAYDLNRTRASELLGFMVSDLDREYSLERYHAVPVAYGLKGYSLPTKTLRDMIEYVLHACWMKGIYTPVCSFDGQWFRMAVRDRFENPLTLLQLQKDLYSEVKKMSKGQIIKYICEINVVHIPTDEAPEDVIEIHIEKEKVTVGNGSKSERIVMTPRLVQLLKHSSDVNETKTGNSNEIENTLADMVLSSLPDSYINEMKEDLVDEVATLASNVTEESCLLDSEDKKEENVDTLPDLFSEPQTQSDEHVMNVDTEQDNATQHPVKPTHVGHMTDVNSEFMKTLNTEENIHLMFSELQMNFKNLEISLNELTLNLKSADSINKHFTKAQLITMISPIAGVLKSHGIKCNKSQTKYALTNILSAIFGDGSTIEQKKPTTKIKNPLSLKSLSRKAVQKLPKVILNCVYAQYHFPKALERWQNQSPFGSTIQIEGFDDIEHNNWYSQPEFNDMIGSYLFVVLDAYHQICGLRRVFCGPGMPKAGVYSKPVHIVAEKSDSNGCGLSIALVRDMIDKQSIAYAVQTFSEHVEEALTDINATNEAEFCNIVRNWYLSEDELGLSAHSRCDAKLNIRRWLLGGVRFDEFPPHGSYIKDIPIVLYEGLLIGVERKIQLYPFTKSGTYNVRAVGSLDIENFFGSFQDIDPRGAGVLRPDDIPTAIGVAMELLDARLDPERGFYINTSRKRVYPSKEGMDVETMQYVSNEWNQQFRDVSTIYLRDHAFDLPERRRGKRSRKSGKVSKHHQPARNPFPVREYHKASEAKILPHVRRGLKLDTTDD